MRTRSPAPGWTPPAYPYDRLGALAEMASAHPGGMVDLSVGTPGDPPPPAALAALADADRGGALRGYPASAGSAALRSAAAAWVATTFPGVEGVAPPEVGACVGTKEFVATTPGWLARRTPGRDTVLYPAVSYPTYAMGAELAGLRAVAVPVDDRWCLDLAAVAEEDAERALMLWTNTPANPTGALDDLDAVAGWAAQRDIPVFSDECYAEFTWTGPPRTVLDRTAGHRGVVAVHSLSKRSNLAGLRVGWYSGDPDLVDYLREVRKHAGLMVPGPAQAAAVAALGDHTHVDAQRRTYRARLEKLRRLVADGLGIDAALPDGGFYLWLAAPGGDAWGLARRLAADAGVLGSPGDFYGAAGAGWLRLAVVAPDDRLELMAARLGC